MTTVDIVIPCFRGETTLEALIAEIVPLTSSQITPSGAPWEISHVVLVFDGGTQELAETIGQLSEMYPFVEAVWLSRNFGQHAATLAGISQTTAQWVVTLDEDGQHNPADIGVFLDEAHSTHTNLVYGKPINPPHHGFVRNLASVDAL